MARKISLLIVLLAAFSLARLPLGVFQVGAWFNMFNDFFDQTGAVVLSAEWTFDGDHRCSGCEFVGDQVGEEENVATILEAFSCKIPLLPLDFSKTIVEPSRFVGRVVPDVAFPRDVFSAIQLPPPKLG